MSNGDKNFHPKQVQKKEKKRPGIPFWKMMLSKKNSCFKATDKNKYRIFRFVMQ